MECPGHPYFLESTNYMISAKYNLCTHCHYLYIIILQLGHMQSHLKHSTLVLIDLMTAIILYISVSVRYLSAAKLYQSIRSRQQTVIVVSSDWAEYDGIVCYISILCGHPTSCGSVHEVQGPLFTQMNVQVIEYCNLYYITS